MGVVKKDPFLLGLDEEKKNGQQKVEKVEKYSSKQEADPFLLGQDVKKKETSSGVLEDGTENISQLESKYPLLYQGKKGQQSVDLRPQIKEEYNKQFEEVTGFKLPDSVIPEKYTKNDLYKVYEEEIGSVLNNVSKGTVKSDELSELYERPYGKKIVSDIISEYSPQSGVYGLSKDVYGHETKWNDISKRINATNRVNSVSLENDQLNMIGSEIKDAINKYDLATVRSQSVTTPGEKDVDIQPFQNIDINDPSQYGQFIDKLKGSYLLYSKDGKPLPGEKEKLLAQLQAKLFSLKRDQPIAEDIQGLGQKLRNAVTDVSLLSTRGEDLQQRADRYGTESEENINHFTLGLNYIKDANPAKYKNIVRAIDKKEKIADSDYKMVAQIGQDILNSKVFRGAAENPELLDKETNIDYTTYQDKKAAYAAKIGEYLKEKGFKNYGEYPKRLITRAADYLGLDNKEIVNDLAAEEGLLFYDAIPKSGGNEAISRGIMQPFTGIGETFKGFVSSPEETYLRSQQYDIGQGQLVPNKKGELGQRLGSDRSNIWYDALEGFGQFVPQVLLTRGIGGIASKVISADARLALTASQLKNVETYGGTFISTYLQEYGNAYQQALNTTGDPKTAKAMAAINGTAAALFEEILPDTKIADKATSILRKGAFSEGIVDIIKKGGNPAELAKKGRPFVEKFVKESINITGQEVTEEVATQLTNYITESIFSPKTAKDRDLANELWETAKSTAVQMIIPAVLGGGGAGLNKDFTVNGLHSAAINFEDYKNSLNKALINDDISQQEYNTGISLLSTHRQSLQSAPIVSSEGKKLSSSERNEYAYQDTIVKVNEEKAKNAAGVAKEDYEKIVNSAKEVQREILGITSDENIESQSKVLEAEKAKKELENITKRNELDNKEIDVKIKGLDKESDTYKVQKEKLEQDRKEKNEEFEFKTQELNDQIQKSEESQKKADQSWKNRVVPIQEYIEHEEKVVTPEGEGTPIEKTNVEKKEEAIPEQRVKGEVQPDEISHPIDLSIKTSEGKANPIEKTNIEQSNAGEASNVSGKEVSNGEKFKSKEELASAFKNATGDAIETAKLKMAGISLRNGMRDAGNENSPREDFPYNKEQLDMIDLYDSFGKKSSYLFHSTPNENIESIQKEGLVVGKKAKFEGVSSPSKISLSANEDVAKYYGKDSDAILRVRKGKDFGDLEPDLLAGGEGAYTTGKNISPEDLEIKVKNKWIPLTEYKVEQSLPIQEVNGEQKINKTTKQPIESSKQIQTDEGIAKKGKELADKLRGLKSKKDTLQANVFGIPIAIYDAAIETIATTIEGGAQLAEAIQKGIQYIRDNGGDKLQEKEFEQHINDFSEGKKPKIKTEGEIAETPEEKKQKSEKIKTEEKINDIGKNTEDVLLDSVQHRKDVASDISVEDKAIADKLKLELVQQDADGFIDDMKKVHGKSYLTKALNAISGINKNRVDLDKILAAGIALENEINNIKDGFTENEFGISRSELNKVYAKIQKINVENARTSSKALNTAKTLYNNYDNTVAKENILTPDQSAQKSAIMETLLDEQKLSEAADAHETGVQLTKEAKEEVEKKDSRKPKVVTEKTKVKAKLNDILTDLKDQLKKLDC